MNNEIEIKILEINPKKIEAALLKNKAKFIKRVFQKNAYYETEDTKKSKVFVRLRREGKNCWLTAKSPQIIKNNHRIRKEYEMQLPSFKFGHELLTLLEFKQALISEAKRKYYKLFSCSVELVTLPKIPTYLELEGSEKNILKVARLFGYSKKDYFADSILKAYKIKTNKIVF